MEPVALAPVRIELTITLAGALHIGTGLGLAQIVDDRIVLGPHPAAQGAHMPYIPGSSLKGRLRAHARQMSALLAWEAEQQRRAEQLLFGFGAAPGSLIYPDAYLANLQLARTLADGRGRLQPYLARSERSFVSLSNGRHVALEQRLFRIELADSGLVFTTILRGTLPALEAERALGLLIAAARDVTHLGGYKARGLGACAITIGEVAIGERRPAWRSLLEGLA